MFPIWRIDPGLSRAAAEATGSARRASTSVAQLEDRLDRATLACEAMWHILRDKLGVTDEELLNRMNDLDLTDGELDGKVRKGAVTCPACDRTITSRFPRCMYCGQAVKHDPFA
jgi:hypothetical protein